MPLGQRWIPFLAGKRVPTALAVVPAAVVSVMLTTTGTRIVLDFFVSGDYTNWGASTPLLLSNMGDCNRFRDDPLLLQEKRDLQSMRTIDGRTPNLLAIGWAVVYTALFFIPS